jgi:uncharacterized protein YbjT (DUF2867 family)
MKVLVFGATGPTGRLVVERALEQGHTVTGFTRQPASLLGRHRRPRPNAGDVLDPAAVLRAVEGHDAVISAFGVPYDPFHEIAVYSTGTRNIVQPIIGRTSYADQRRQEQILMRSSLRWTIARPGRACQCGGDRTLLCGTRISGTG